MYEFIAIVIGVFIAIVFLLDRLDERKRRHRMQQHIEEIRNQICGTPKN